MFTGLIREFATVESFKNETLRLKADYEPQIGDSIAINGACLTVTAISKPFFEVELSKESRDLLALENYSGKVHMEPAMQLGERIEGHMVQGHIDCVATVKRIEQSENAFDFYLDIPKAFIKYMMPKGSIAVEGISLTINDVFESSIRLTIIKHTMSNTLFGSYKIGQRVNIESDMFARYIYNMLHPNETKETPSWAELDSIAALY